MNRYWRIQLRDATGIYWQVLDQLWSDDVVESAQYHDEMLAHSAAIDAKRRVASSPEWFPKIKVVAFKGSRK
jgi:hypothetical protein